MTVYKSLDPARQARSVTFQEGVADGTEDTISANMCPPGIPHGPLQEGWMYRAGYDQAFMPFPCACDGSCEDRGRQDASDILAPGEGQSEMV